MSTSVLLSALQDDFDDMQDKKYVLMLPGLSKTGYERKEPKWNKLPSKKTGFERNVKETLELK